MKEVDIKAYAKINLTLDIAGKLPNGYHEIRSVFQAVDIYDYLSISEEKKGFCFTGSFICKSEDNLVAKSKKALESVVGEELPCRIHLMKNIPVCAGLGGGSSDAAAVIIGLDKLYSLKLSLEQLMSIGLKVGSDVPFFIANHGTALVEGVGEKIKNISRKVSKFYVLARPHKRLSTAKMYSLFDDTGKGFFEIAQELCPDLKKLYAHFSSADEVGMSGSGPTMFAGFSSYDKAVKAVDGFGIECFNGDFFVCKPSRNTYEFIK